MLWRGKGGNRSLADRKLPVRDNQLHIDSNRLTEALALRTGTERIIEAEEPGMRLLVLDTAIRAFEAGAEAPAFTGFKNVNNRAPVAVAKRCFDRIRNTGHRTRGAANDQTVNQDEDIILRNERR